MTPVEGIATRQIIIITAIVANDGNLLEKIYDEQLVKATAEIAKLKPNSIYGLEPELKSYHYDSGYYIFVWEVEL